MGTDWSREATDAAVKTRHDEAVRDALVELRATLLECVNDVDEVLRRVTQTYASQRDAGSAWHEILDAQPKPLAVSQLHRRLNDVANTAGVLRRATVEALLAEGVPKSRVAKILGITHQRISQITREGR